MADAICFKGSAVLPVAVLEPLLPVEGELVLEPVPMWARSEAGTMGR